ncbi:MAG: PAS domain S-box protein [Synechococcaceae cyanobacterium RL_1_2]|nr:PAS domain S-box protein [Synechococcaceae cyanobacterium RL_1_2]
MDDHRQPLGIVTERDLVQIKALGLALEDHLVETMMSKPVFTITQEASLLAANGLMDQYMIQRLAVVSAQGRVEGMIDKEMILQVLNPLELYKLTEMLEQKVSILESEKLEILKERNEELEQQVTLRTVELSEQVNRERLISDLALKINASSSLEEIWLEVVDKVQKLLGCDRFLIYQFNPQGGGEVVAEAYDPNFPSMEQDRFSDECWNVQQEKGQRQGNVIAINNVNEADYSDCYLEVLMRYQIKATLIILLEVEGEVWGTMAAHQCSDYRWWSEANISLMNEVAVHISIAIKQQLTIRKLQQEITIRKEAERLYQHSEERYASLFTTVPVGVFRTDGQGNCLYLNQKAIEMIDLSPQATTGLGWLNAVHPEDRSLVTDTWANVLSTRNAAAIEYRFVNQEGRVRWVYGQTKIECNFRGGDVGLVTSITDITDLKRMADNLQASEQRYYNLVSHLPVGIFRTDTNGNCTFVNNFYCQIVGTTIAIASIGNGNILFTPMILRK